MSRHPRTLNHRCTLTCKSHVGHAVTPCFSMRYKWVSGPHIRGRKMPDPTTETSVGPQPATSVPSAGTTAEPNAVPAGSPTGGFEAQTMVRRVKTYYIVDSEFNSLAATTVTATVLFFFASLFFSVGIDCLITKMSFGADTHLSAGQLAFFHYATNAGFCLGGVFFVLTVGTWIFGWSIFRHVRKTSREGKIISG